MTKSAALLGRPIGIAAIALQAFLALAGIRALLWANFFMQKYDPQKQGLVFRTDAGTLVMAVLLGFAPVTAAILLSTRRKLGWWICLGSDLVLCGSTFLLFLGVQEVLAPSRSPLLIVSLFSGTLVALLTYPPSRTYLWSRSTGSRRAFEVSTQN